MKIEPTNWTGVPSLVSCSAACRAAPARLAATSERAAGRYCSVTNSRIGRTLRPDTRERNNGNPDCFALRARDKPARELGSGANTELRVRAREVHLDRVHRHVQGRGDLLVR